MNSEHTTKSSKYPIIAIVISIAFVAICILYQYYEYYEFWSKMNHNDKANDHAVEFMGLYEILQLFMVAAFGFSIGLIISLRSLSMKNVNRKSTIVALLFNALPLLILVYALIRNNL